MNVFQHLTCVLRRVKKESCGGESPVVVQNKTSFRFGLQIKGNNVGRCFLFHGLVPVCSPGVEDHCFRAYMLWCSYKCFADYRKNILSVNLTNFIHKWSSWMELLHMVLIWRHLDNRQAKPSTQTCCSPAVSSTKICCVRREHDSGPATGPTSIQTSSLGQRITSSPHSSSLSEREVICVRQRTEAVKVQSRPTYFHSFWTFHNIRDSLKF